MSPTKLKLCGETIGVVSADLSVTLGPIMGQMRSLDNYGNSRVMAARAQEFRERVPGVSKSCDSRLPFHFFSRLNFLLYQGVSSVDSEIYDPK
jgi:hypothetical protein